MLGTFLLLTADAPVLMLIEENTGYSRVTGWVMHKDPLPLRLNSDEPGIKPRFISQNSGEYYGKVMHAQNRIDVTWYNGDNAEYGRFSEQWPHDMPLPLYHISPDPDYLLSVDFSNRVRIINRNGNEEKAFQLFTDTEFNTENATFCEFIDQKEQIIVAFRQVLPIDDTRQGYHSYLALVDYSGNEFFNRDFPGWQINGVSAADDGAYFILPLHKYDRDDNSFSFRTVLLDGDGIIVADLPLQHNRAVFSADGTRVLFYKNEQAWLYDIAKNVIINEFRPGSDQNIFMHALFIDEKNLLVVQDGAVYREANNWAYHKIALQVFDTAGKQLQSLDLENLSVYKPALNYDTDANRLVLGHSRGWQKYRINY
jgi:hypothetical protein